MRGRWVLAKRPADRRAQLPPNARRQSPRAAHALPQTIKAEPLAGTTVIDDRAQSRDEGADPAAVRTVVDPKDADLDQVAAPRWPEVIGFAFVARWGGTARAVQRRVGYGLTFRGAYSNPSSSRAEPFWLGVSAIPGHKPNLGSECIRVLDDAEVHRHITHVTAEACVVGLARSPSFPTISFGRSRTQRHCGSYCGLRCRTRAADGLLSTGGDRFATTKHKLRCSCIDQLAPN